MEAITEYLMKSAKDLKNKAKAWRETIMLPTYEVGEEEKNPIFLEKRVYQGSSGVVYPYPVVEKVADEKKDKAYEAIFIENEYIKVMVLPELGGRIQMAYDKVQKRNFVYYNQVIKPALVGLTGPWVSGGIEFNWPQHHRPSTYLPTDSVIENNADGSVTVWCSEVEKMFRTKGMQGFTLHPDKSYIEIKAKVYNRTPFPQTFLWWANPAVEVNDDYHSVFPPDVHAVFDHGKRDVSSFPIATGEYYKQDYSAGVDISKYKNIPVPTSYMAIKSKFDFVGGYDQSVNAGLLHVADHNVSPGKKQWTWGCGDFGKAWDRNLTDEDGPYIELMTGVYTDNQPDFTWLQPGEEKSWVQYFMPYAQVGYVKNASKDVIMNIELKGNEAELCVYTTSVFKNLSIEIKTLSGETIFSDKATVSPYDIYKKNVETGKRDASDIIVVIKSEDGREMLRYQAEKPEIKPIPAAAVAAKEPEEISSIEDLFLTGLHLEQYRHATYSPLDYYEEALKREPSDVRCNNAVGLILMRQGQFAKAEKYFITAVETLTKRNPNPYDGEPYYNLGWSLMMQGRIDESYEAFFKSTWNSAWQDSAYLAIAQIEGLRGNWESALEKVDRSLYRNWTNHKARQLKASILRKLGRDDEALAFVQESLKLDNFNGGCLFEQYLLTNKEEDLLLLKAIMRASANSYIEYALDFATAGLYAEAIELLTILEKEVVVTDPMVYYHLGYFALQLDDTGAAKKYYAKAEALCPDRCFPNRIEDVIALQVAIEQNPSDAHALYYLGNFWYGHKQYGEARDCWEKSVTINSSFPTVLRNLSLAYYNKFDKKREAKELLEKAFDLDKTDSRLFMELDQLYKKVGYTPKERLEVMRSHINLVEERDDLYIEYLTLLNLTGSYAEVKELISGRMFHPWEGGEGKISKQYTVCRIELAKEAIQNGKFAEALELLHEIDSYPHNLGEGKLITAEENDVDYYKGLAYRGLGNAEEAKLYLERATLGSSEPQQAFFYNDKQPDKIFFQGLAWRALGEEDKARSVFNKLISHGEKHLFDDCKLDYFAVSLPDLAIWDDDLNVRNQVHCYFVMGLGKLGLGDTKLAKEYLAKVLSLDMNHIDCNMISL